jgi:hypothetical protein
MSQKRPVTVVPGSKEDILRRMLRAQQLTFYGVAQSSSQLTYQSKIVRRRWQIFLTVVITLSIWLLTKYLRVRLTYKDFISAINEGLKKSTSGAIQRLSYNGTAIALAYTYPVVNWLIFGGNRFAQAVVFSYFTKGLQEDFFRDIPNNLTALYNTAQNNPSMSAEDIICTAFGKKLGSSVCQDVCKNAQPSFSFGNTVANAMVSGINTAVFLSNHGGPAALAAGAAVAAANVVADLVQSAGKYQKCKEEQSQCYFTQDTACRFFTWL